MNAAVALSALNCLKKGAPGCKYSDSNKRNINCIIADALAARGENVNVRANSYQHKTANIGPYAVAI